MTTTPISPARRDGEVPNFSPQGGTEVSSFVVMIAVVLPAARRPGHHQSRSGASVRRRARTGRAVPRAVLRVSEPDANSTLEARMILAGDIGGTEDQTSRSSPGRRHCRFSWRYSSFMLSKGFSASRRLRGEIF